MASRPDVAVVVPVFNKLRFLPALLDSLVAQQTRDATFVVVAVDDGSTDGSGELLDRYAGEHGWLQVIHQPNSGWPGQPRNRGVAATDSRYVFFADADDFFGTEAIERMVAAADALSADVLLPKVVQAEAPDAPAPLYDTDYTDVPLPLRFRTLTPHKLFRRAFLDEHEIRFVEHRAPLEDGMLLARAYLLARRVSMVTDYAYYYRVDGAETSISVRRRDPHEHRRSVETILATVRELCDDREAVDEISLDIYRRKGLRYIGPRRMPGYPRRLRAAHVEAAADLAESSMPRELEDRLPPAWRWRSRLVRLRDPQASYVLALAERAGPPPVRVRGQELVLDLGTEATVAVTADVKLRVRDAV
ncbi:MAG: glycosyltransferase, partial [Actinomycetota bacterium]|nr:glycosyltransferase [Actinomycetota bacterium]